MCYYKCLSLFLSSKSYLNSLVVNNQILKLGVDIFFFFQMFRKNPASFWNLTTDIDLSTCP